MEQLFGKEFIRSFDADVMYVLNLLLMNVDHIILTAKYKQLEHQG